MVFKRILFVALSFCLVSPGWAGPLTLDQQKEVRALVKDTLLQEPKIVVDSLVAYREAQARSASARIKRVIAEQASDLFFDKQSGVLGNPKGNAVLVEFIDYRCKHCRTMGVIIQDILRHDHQLRVVVKELPIFQGVSITAAKAAMAARQQVRFAPMHEALLRAPLSMTDDQVLRLASQVGLDVPTLKNGMSSEAITDRLARNFALARSMQIVGTPAFVVSDLKGQQVVFIGGAVDGKQLRKALAQVRRAHG